MQKKATDRLKEMNKGCEMISKRGTGSIAEYRLDSLLRNYKVSTFEYDIKKDIIYIRKDEARLEGFTDHWFKDDGEVYYLENLLGRQKELVRASMVETSVMKIMEARENTSGEIISYEVPVIYGKGNTRWVNILADTLLDENGEPFWIMGYCRDVQQQRKERDRLEKIAQTDPLTGFRNRKAGFDKIEEWLREQKNCMHYIAVVDLDNFKDANDMFGHAFGDSILRDATQCMRDTLDRETIYCRTGGDEFLLFGKCEDSEHALKIMSELKEKLHRTANSGEGSFEVSASIGISIHPLQETELSRLYDMADMAMYHAKKNELDVPAIYNDSMDAIEIVKR